MLFRSVYWEIGGQKNASLPPYWPGRFSALSSSKYPLAVKFNGVPARVYLSVSSIALLSQVHQMDARHSTQCLCVCWLKLCVLELHNFVMLFQHVVVIVCPDLF